MANDKRHPRKRFWVWSALAGLVSAAAFLASAELVALVFAREGSPILAVGSFVIDIVPRWAKEFAIETFGANDKLFLLLGLAVGVAVAAAVAGVLQFLRPPLGVIALGIAGVLSTAAIVTRAGATALAWLPPVVGTIVGSLLLWLLVTKLRSWRDDVVASRRDAVTSTDAAAGSESAAASGTASGTASANPAAAAAKGPLDRRSFFRLLGITAAGAAIVGVGARVVNVTTGSIDAVRKALKLPAAQEAVTIPDGADLDIPGISPLFTSNKDFYRVDTALTVPSIDPDSWRLTIDGMVGEKIELSFDDLVGMGLNEYSITLTCVSNEVGGDLLGTAKWLGIPVRDVLKKAAPKSGADMVLSRSIDGFTASTPLASLTDPKLDAILAVGMNGEPLPLEHGFPVRMVVPGLYGYVSATKWLTELKVTTFAKDEAYWTPRGYSAKAPIKFSSRIDTPRLDKAIDAGPVKVAGVAWAQTVGIKQVDVKIDDADWQKATLSVPVNVDTWVQWYVDWEATPGTHYVTVRATDKNGKQQVEERAPIAPDGSSGLQKTLIRVN
ncbi:MULTISPECIES: molybdopterin-dependent oxidoreductase [unclassified Leifsonia]|uniref:molybdopterin-dependent oxidoreductase n=1 Tax=unclassified Leifsonia TaxID=2663824 RepID=UPI0006F30073|nr:MULTISPECIES: molybdopterin-dependent oxidoreductase [unclassified Leifsonia]KQX05183.1 oxidoreductase [Leifsonia sp. Root1293]KRA08816.1 oxidoreductase [Leifsonia sp. Root60]